MAKKYLFVCLMSIFILTSFLSAEKFAFMYTTGHTYTIESTVEQEVFVNDIKSHDAIVTRTITVDEIEAQANGSCRIKNTCQQSEIAKFPSGRSQSAKAEYSSEFTRDKSGAFVVEDLMPVVTVPVFTDKEVAIGDTWSATGEEIHDLSETFGIEETVRLPFTAQYTYDSIEQKGENTFHVIHSKHSIEHDFQNNPNIETQPVQMRISSSQVLYWDKDKGCVDHYTEEYQSSIKTNNGDIILFKGITNAKVINFTARQDDESLSSIKTQIGTLKSDTIKAHISPEGITLSLENIQFEPNSAILQRKAKEQLQDIVELLKSLPNNDLLITGHAALSGTKEGRQKTSEERAESVANYLAELGVREMEKMEIIGRGAEEPIAPNTTEENMAKNRRVEITVKNN